MIDSLRDQLLNLGFKASPAPERKPGGGKPHPGRPGQGQAPHGKGPHGKGAHDRHPGKPAHGNGPGGKPGQGAGPGGSRAGGRSEHPGRGPRRPGAPAAGGAGGMDLGKAYALRAQQEKQERIQAEQLKQEEARARREARARLEELLQGKALNDPAAEIARHFEYGGKIKRIYVNADQLKALNAGELGVVQLNGRYLLVAAAVLDEAEAVFPPAVALKGPSEAPMVAAPVPAQDDPYADPRYQVPDDLVW